jgi:hypothetical protein
MYNETRDLVNITVSLIMTPRILHRYAVKYSYLVPKLIGALVVFAVWGGLAWYMVSQNYFVNTDQRAFCIVGVPHLGAIWCGGLLVIYSLFRKLPERLAMNSVMYHWNNIVSYPIALIFSIWLVGLSAITLALPIVIVYKFIAE